MPAAKFEIKRKCSICGEEFLAKTIESWYCSPRCSKIAWKRRKDEEKRNLRLDEVVKSIHKETTNIDKIVKELQLEKEKITGRLKTLYNDRCDGVISADTYKELASEFEQKLKQINEKIEDQNIKKYKIKNKANILPDYTKKIKKLLDLNKPKKELIDTLVDKIVIDKDRNITICFKYDIVPEVTFKYENRNLVRNPYGRKGKNNN